MTAQLILSERARGSNVLSLEIIIKAIAEYHVSSSSSFRKFFIIVQNVVLCDDNCLESDSHVLGILRAHFFFFIVVLEANGMEKRLFMLQ